MSKLVLAGYSQKELIQDNACWLYCQVDLISDVAEGDGMHLSEHWITTHTPRQLVHGTKWPRQGNPPRRQWAVCNRALKESIFADHRAFI